jgi:hypothetical protein
MGLLFTISFLISFLSSAFAFAFDVGYRFWLRVYWVYNFIY